MPDGPPPEQPKVIVEVVWGDVTAVDAHVYAVGHYQGVEPQRAELALDEAVSGVTPGGELRQAPARDHAAHAARHAPRCARRCLVFPLGGRRTSRRLVAVAGMGRPGTFDRGGLSVSCRGHGLDRHAAEGPGRGDRADRLRRGTLTIVDSVRGLVEGINDGVVEIVASEELRLIAPVTKLMIVERERGRAEEILEAAPRGARPAEDPSHHEHTPPVSIYRAKLTLTPRATRQVSVEESIALLADVGDQVRRGTTHPADEKALARLLAEIPQTKQVQSSR